MSVAGINVLVEETRAAQDAARQPLLAIRGVKTYYGNIIALKGVDLDVHEGEIVTLIGANGAGKSTLMMTIFGTPRCSRRRASTGNNWQTRARSSSKWRPSSISAPICKFSRTVMRGKMRRPSGAWAMRRRAMAWVGSRVMSRPS